MSKPNSQNYSYAKNSFGKLINVSIAKRNEQYFCPICGEQMTPHIGKIRRWHFVHKNAENCSYESYLHNLAKLRIREAFLSSEHFHLSYKALALCSHSCPYLGYPKCECIKFVDFDLRKFYDTCVIEATYHQYRADLLLTSSIFPERPPILIEIKVTHECTQDKINSGIRIIEIPIHSENQIDDIIENCKIIGVRNGNINSKEIALHNFNKVESFDPTGTFDEWEDIFSRKGTIVFCLDSNGRFYSFDCHCYEVKNKVPKNVHYFITNIAIPFKEIFQGFSRRGIKVRNCFLCRFSKQNYFGERICVRYKEYELPQKPSPYTASSCPHYKEDVAEQNIDVKDVYGHKYYYHICKEIL